MAAATGDIASLVDLAPDDISAVLLPARGAATAITASADLDATVRRAHAVLDQLDAQTRDEHCELSRDHTGLLQAAVGALQEQCLQVAAALAAQGSGDAEPAAALAMFGYST